jgi:hypothetical protein
MRCVLAEEPQVARSHGERSAHSAAFVREFPKPGTHPVSRTPEQDNMRFRSWRRRLVPAGIACNDYYIPEDFNANRVDIAAMKADEACAGAAVYW